MKSLVNYKNIDFMKIKIVIINTSKFNKSICLYFLLSYKLYILIVKFIDKKF